MLLDNFKMAIKLKRKRQQKGPVPKSKENGAVTNSRVKCKKPKIFTRRCAHLPIIYKKPIFRKAARSPADHTPRKRSQTRSQRKNQGGGGASGTHTYFLLAQQESKTRWRGGEGTHTHSFGNAFIRTYSFFRNAYIHTYSVLRNTHN